MSKETALGTVAFCVGIPSQLIMNREYQLCCCFKRNSDIVGHKLSIEHEQS
jgi:hypothetical protein